MKGICYSRRKRRQLRTYYRKYHVGYALIAVIPPPQGNNSIQSVYSKKDPTFPQSDLYNLLFDIPLAP